MDRRERTRQTRRSFFAKHETKSRDKPIHDYVLLKEKPSRALAGVAQFYSVTAKHRGCTSGILTGFLS